jgi:hypothetical protein
MCRVPVLLAVLALGGVLLASRTGLSNAQDEPSGPARQDFVGSWRLIITSQGRPPISTLATFTSDGTLSAAIPPVMPARPGSPYKLLFTSTGHGVWIGSGESSAAITFVVLRRDEQGNDLGTTTFRGTWQVGKDGQAVSGPFTATIADPTGKAVSTFTGTVEGSRIAVEAMGTPAATPGA